MAKKMTHTRAFHSYGMVSSNVRNSWSAVNEATGTVVVTLWHDSKAASEPHLYEGGIRPDRPDTRPGKS
jgi:hypothetical protein